MTQQIKTQKNFSGGEVSPDIEARTDLAKYESSLSDSLNVMCTNKGDLIPRPGTEFVSFTNGLDLSTKRAPKKARLVPFKIAEDESYMLEFTDKKLRIFKDQKVLTGITDVLRMPFLLSPVSSNNLELNWGDALATPESGFLFVRPDKFPYEAGDGPFYFTFDEANITGKELGQPAALENKIFTFQHKDSSAPGVQTTDFNSAHEMVESDRFWVHSVEREVFAPSVERSGHIANQFCDIVHITDRADHVGVEGAQLEVTSTGTSTYLPMDFNWTFENKADDGVTSLDYFDSPYSESEIFELQYSSIADNLYLCHENHRPMIVTRTGTTSFRFVKFYFVGGPWRPASTYGENWTGQAVAVGPDERTYDGHGTYLKNTNTADVYPNPRAIGDRDRFPLVSGGEIQVPSSGGLPGKNLNQSGINVHMFLSETSPSIKTADSGFTADPKWIGRKVRFRFNIGASPGLTNFNYGTTGDDSYEQEQATQRDPQSTSSNEASAYQPFQYDSNAYMWAEGTIEEERHTSPSSLSTSGSERSFSNDSPGKLYVGADSMLAPGDIVKVTGTNTISHSVVPKSATEPYALDANEFYVHSIADADEVYLCDSYAKVGVAGQAYTQDASGTRGQDTITVSKRLHTNPTNQLRVRINDPFKFTNASSNRPWYWVKPSASSRIGHLFEERYPDGTGGWPKTVEIFDNRLWFGGNNEFSGTLAGSAKGDFTNFSPDDGGSNVVSTVNDPEGTNDWSVRSCSNPRTFPTDSFVYTLQEGTSDPILWMKALPQGLVVATNNAIYMSEKPKRNETYGPTNWKMKIISEEGANQVKPVYVDGKIYYINARGDKLLSLSYSLEADAHKPAVESILSEHLFQYGIKEIAFARSPIQVLWLISNNGDLISGIILDSEEQKAFFKHRLAGPSFQNNSYPVVNSIAVIPSYDKKFDQLWISSERGTVDTVTETADQADANGKNNYIEVLTQYSPYLENIEEFVGLDLSVTYNTYARATANDLDSITDINEGRTNAPTDGALKIETGSAHGFSVGDLFKITGVAGGLSYLNSGLHYTANSGTSGTAIYAQNRVNPYGNQTTLSLSGSKVPWSGTGRVVPRKSTINFIGASDHNDIGEAHRIGLSGSFFEGGLEWLKNNSPIISGVPTVSVLAPYDYSPESNQGILFVAGFRQHIYFTTLPPVLNNQLGDMDNSYINVASISLRMRDAFQFKIGNRGDSESDSVDLINESRVPSSTTVSLSSMKITGVEKADIFQSEENTLGQIVVYPKAGYPFLVQSISIRGERATRQ